MNGKQCRGALEKSQKLWKIFWIAWKWKYKDLLFIDKEKTPSLKFEVKAKKNTEAAHVEKLILGQGILVLYRTLVQLWKREKRNLYDLMHESMHHFDTLKKNNIICGTQKFYIQCSKLIMSECLKVLEKRPSQL
jgi:hypothetical protein